MKNSNLINALNNCLVHCLNCADACLDADDVSKMKDCIRTDRACAEICSATVKLLAMDSPHAKAMVELCHDICRKCAEECSRHDHQHCKGCAEACNKCAQACEEYLR
jgi:hypothetical protein